MTPYGVTRQQEINSVVICNNKNYVFDDQASGPWDELALYIFLTRRWRVMHICQWTRPIIGSDNVFSPVRWQAIIWTRADLLPITP